MKMVRIVKSYLIRVQKSFPRVVKYFGSPSICPDKVLWKFRVARTHDGTHQKCTWDKKTANKRPAQKGELVPDPSAADSRSTIRSRQFTTVHDARQHDTHDMIFATVIEHDATRLPRALQDCSFWKEAPV